MASETTPPDHAESSRGYRIEIFLISFAGLLLEIAYTRIISFKLFYYYTYLVIGLALLGIGTGGVLVAISGRLRRAATETILLWGLLLGAVSVGMGYVVVAVVRTDTRAIWEYGTRDSFVNVAGLLAICLALFGSFVAIGVMIATLFARRSAQIGRLYFADLLGAGIACAVVVSLLNRIGPPATIVLAGLVMAVAGLRLAWQRRSRVLAPVALVAVVLAVAVVRPGILPAQRTDELKADLGDSGKWSALFRVDVVDLGDQKLLFHDGLLGSSIQRWDGNPASLGRFDSDPRSFPFTPKTKPPGKVMIIGAAGGNEILASLHLDAKHIDAIELNPVTHSLVTHDYDAYTGHLAENPRVNYMEGDGRSYLARSDGKYNLIWYPAPDSYAATNAATSSAYVLSESYLYTSDAIVDSLRHLAQGGMVATQYGEYNYEARPNRTTRYVATARHALAELGIKDPSRHIIVVTSTTNSPAAVSTILVKRDPFTPAEVNRLIGSLDAVPGATVRYAPGHPVHGNSVTAVATLPKKQLDHWYDTYQYDVRPITDDAPFFWHFTPFTDTITNVGHPIDRVDLEVTVGERVLLLLLVIATLFAAVFLLLPFITVRRIWSALPRKGRSALYFAALGLGFMFFEVTLIQRLVLFLGYPTYSLTVTLASILVFTGVGALLSERYKQRPRPVMPLLLAAMTGLTVFYLWGLPVVTDALLGWPLGARMLLTFAVLAPLGICLGAFMPLGLGAVARLTPYDRYYVAWGWAVNGFASVIGAVLTTILAMALGFRVVLMLALAVYVVAVVVLRSLLRAAPAEPPAPAEEVAVVSPAATTVGAATPAPS
jgi:MFS family permease